MANVPSEDFAARLLRGAGPAAVIKGGEMKPAPIEQRKVCGTGAVARSDADYIRVDEDARRM